MLVPSELGHFVTTDTIDLYEVTGNPRLRLPTSLLVPEDFRLCNFSRDPFASGPTLPALSTTRTYEEEMRRVILPEIRVSQLLVACSPRPMEDTIGKF